VLDEFFVASGPSKNWPWFVGFICAFAFTVFDQ
jgi:hypothetical protein